MIEISTASPVTWQTALWTLIALAACVMSQPCGRICGVKSGFKIYLRSSPMVCLCDILCIPAQVCIYKIRMGTPFALGLKLVLYHRFGTYKDDQPESLQTLKYTTWLRWMFFVIGAAGSALKLLVMTGIPWTKTWGLLFLISFFAVELLIIVSWRMDSTLPPTERERQIFDLFPDSDTKRLLQRAECGLLLLSVALRSILLLGLFNDLSRGKGQTHINALSIAWEKLAITGSCCCIGYAILFMYCVISWKEPLRNHMGMPLSTWGIWFASTLLWVAYSGSEPKSAFWNCVDVLLFHLIIIQCMLLGACLRRLQRNCPIIAKNLFLVPPEVESLGEALAPADPGNQSVWALIGFLYHVILCVWWYAFRYDPLGTVNPSWMCSDSSEAHNLITSSPNLRECSL